MASEKRIEELSGTEHFVVGVSPQYWSHSPLSIKSLNDLGLVDGIDCLVLKDEARFIPVSKCELQGVIVNVDRKSNGSCLYLLDDGTGIVDCLSWVDNDLYSLPSLIPHDDNNGPKAPYRVGDVVRVFGKIKTVSIGGIRETIKAYGREWKVHDCVREVHITSMTCLSLNAQANHWLRCIQFARRALIDSLMTRGIQDVFEGASSDEIHYLQQRKSMLDPVCNGPDVLRLLGQEIASKAIGHADFPAPDDACGSWRVFGAGCQCNLSYLNSLLYCHCQATVVALDSHFKFRDALLEILLQMEGNVEPSSDGQPIENYQLRFKYKTLVNNGALRKVAASVVANGNKSSSSLERLFLQTFAALRKDGIVSLLDRDADMYLLVSRERVLEPHCRKAKTNSFLLERRVLHTEQPAYLKNVTSARLQYVKKTITDNR